ncbi:LytR C-terminal domain-containing protein [Kitasatospora mediocidica]|uniref:LytR C-terminal domain-containing protein n=1 Tax=Kitasatospora mediocidica TaxID=58352 RepID=UPI001E45589D|nr:LytR C-terminal domain-containing protein [Kitasatospora mediocidica]
MLTPQGLKGKQFRVTGTSYPRLGPPPRRGRRIMMVVSSTLALALIALGGVQLVGIFTGKAKHGAAQACASAKPSGKPLAAPVAATGPASAAASAASPSAAASGATEGASPAVSAAPLPVAAASAIPQPQTVTVNVYNATDKAGLAAKTADELKKRGFTVGKVGNAPSALDKKLPGTAELIAGPAGIGAATLLGSQVAGAASMADTRTDASVDFVVGDAYTALLDPTAAATALADALKPSAAASPGPGSC